jgi:hypothetical protein
MKYFILINLGLSFCFWLILNSYSTTCKSFFFLTNDFIWPRWISFQPILTPTEPNFFFFVHFSCHWRLHYTPIILFSISIYRWNSTVATELLIGENRGMGAVKNILAKDFLGNWMTIYSTIVDGTTQALYDKFTQYRYFRPAICGTPFLTQHLRWENYGNELVFVVLRASYSGCLATPCPTLPPPSPTSTHLFPFLYYLACTFFLTLLSLFCCLFPTNLDLKWTHGPCKIGMSGTSSV